MTNAENHELRQFAHDLRNILSSVYTTAQVLELSLDKPETKNEQLMAHTIADAVQKIDALISTHVNAAQTPEQ